MCAQVPGGQERRWIPGTGVKGGRELPCEFLELILGPLQGQEELLTTEQSLQAPAF